MQPVLQVVRPVAQSFAPWRPWSRVRRKRVVFDAFDQVHKGVFEKAPAIVPNNDIKYDVNKKRSIRFAEEKKDTIFWSVAKELCQLCQSREHASCQMAVHKLQEPQGARGLLETEGRSAVITEQGCGQPATV